jgi:hypothetical protein
MEALTGGRLAQMKIRYKAIAAAALCCAPLSSFASAPWFVDWCNTAPFRQFVLRLSYLNNDAVKTRSQSIPRIQLSCGLTKWLEVYLKDDELDNQYPIKVGNSDATLGFKGRLWENKKGDQLGFRYELSLPWASDGLGTDHYGHGISAIGTKALGKDLKAYGMVGETIPGFAAKKNDTLYGVLVGYNVTPKWMLGSEVYGNTPTSTGANQEFAAAIGTMYEQSKSCKFYGRVAHSFEGFSRFAVHVGVQLTFGPK